MATGEEKLTCCHPEADSPLKVDVASSDPELLHRFPICVPVFVDAL
jgi:hypothetical protein